MTDTAERRRRRPRRPAAYLILATVCAVFALGSAFEATRPPGPITVIWRGEPRFVSQRKARDVGPAAAPFQK